VDLNNKKIVITGAAAGIGAALVARLAQYDVQIVAADRQAIPPTSGTHAQVHAYTGDIGSAAGVDALLAHAQAVMGGVDIFIANAGFGYYGRFQDHADWERLQALYSVNLISPLYTLGKLRAAGGSMMVMLASAQSHFPVPGYAAYSASKAALDGFAQAYRYEQDTGIHLLLVYPIGTSSKFFNASGAPLAWPLQTPEQVAEATVRGIERDAKSVYPSLLFWTLLFLDRFLPVKWLVTKVEAERLYRWLAERAKR
jgi:uncharacterized protein